MPSVTPAKHVVKAGTDGATICAFDAAALPKDFDARVEADPVGLMEDLRDEGRLWFGGTGGDGSHIVHVLVNNSAAFLESEKAAWSGEIDVPSGKLWVCGAEYMANNPQRGSKFTPTGGLGRYKMGKGVKVPPGRYLLRAYEIDSDVAAARQKVTAAQLLQIIPIIFLGLGGLVAFFSSFALVVSLFGKLVQFVIGSPLATVGWHALPFMLAGVCLGEGAFYLGLYLARQISRLPSVKRDRAAYEAQRAEHPDVILDLRAIAEAKAAAVA